MVQITDIDPQSNEYFFITGLRENTLKAGRNSFVVNCTPKILVGQELSVQIKDANNKILPVSIVPTNSAGIDGTQFGETYVVYVSADSPQGIAKIQISAIGIDTGAYTGSFAFYRGKAYPINDTQRLPLLVEPTGVEAFPEAEVIWSRNLLIDVSGPTESEVRFFDFPSISVFPKIYNSPNYPIASYRLATGSCSAIAVYPKNNELRNFDFAGETPIYQLYYSSGTKFNSSMENEQIRIKNPYVRNFTYTNYNNNEISFAGALNTDFIATIKRVVNDTTLLIDIPFAVATELANRATNLGVENEDSVYNRNNLVDPFGYNTNDDPQKQTVFFKRNFFTLSIGEADFEVVYKNIPTVLTQSFVGGDSTNPYKKSLVEIEFNNLRTYCGNLDRYEIYGRSMNAPETRTLVATGKIEPDEALFLNNFNNAYYQSAGKFYSSQHTSRYWITSSASITFSQSHAVLIDGVRIGHPNNSDKTAYVILKDDTTGNARTSAIISPSLLQKSYWYATRDAFLNSFAQPSASYDSANNISQLVPYSSSRELLTLGNTYDSNPIKLRSATVYKFSMNVKPFIENGPTAQLFVYFVSGNNRKQIGLIESPSEFVVDGVYTTTFFSDIVQFGTIILVPVEGYWDISNLSLVPYRESDYSIDSFSVKIPFGTFVSNELYEIEAELYDSDDRLAYGKGSYSFNYNKMYRPLKKQFFINPLGIINNGGGTGTVVYDGGNAFTTEFTNTLDGGGS